MIKFSNGRRKSLKNLIGMDDRFETPFKQLLHWLNSPRRNQHQAMVKIIRIPQGYNFESTISKMSPMPQSALTNISSQYWGWKRSRIVFCERGSETIGSTTPPSFLTTKTSIRCTSPRHQLIRTYHTWHNKINSCSSSNRLRQFFTSHQDIMGDDPPLRTSHMCKGRFHFRIWEENLMLRHPMSHRTGKTICSDWWYFSRGRSFSRLL